MVYTIGHSTHTIDVFLGLLKLHRIEVIADVRSIPYSAWTPQFNSAALQQSLRSIEVKYVFLGKELGGRPKGMNYAQRAQSPEFLAGIERVERGAAQYRIALMCAEEDPGNCHRKLLVGRVLIERGMELLHIRGKGRVETENHQASLFNVEQAFSPA